MKLVSPQNDWKNAMEITEEQKSVAMFLAKQHGWIVTERDGKTYMGPADRETPAKPPVVPEFIKLKVRYDSQRDSQVPGQASRSCFSSSVGMLADYLKPNLFTTANFGDEHLRRVLQYGDTTDPAAQMKALAHYGIKARRLTNLGFADIDAQLRKGNPVPIGILIHGHVSAPSGGGHWIVVIGKTSTGYLVHDPYGELDLVNGFYLHADGQSRNYSRENLGKRWMVDGPSTGWGVIVG